MTERYDAGLGAAAYLLAAHERVVRDFPACTVNFGMAQFGPGAFNIIPDRAELALEFRAPTVAEHDALQARLLSLAESTAAAHGLSLVAEPYGRYEAAPMSARAQAAFSRAAESLALSHIPLSSGAGHDGQSLAHLCDCGMIFIPSRDGISHSPREHSEWDDCVNGANVLLRAALIMMS
jgi:N-carbamoyl-L-amino-acid hydrolase